MHSVLFPFLIKYFQMIFAEYHFAAKSRSIRASLHQSRPKSRLYVSFLCLFLMLFSFDNCIFFPNFCCSRLSHVPWEIYYVVFFLLGNIKDNFEAMGAWSFKIITIFHCSNAGMWRGPGVTTASSWEIVMNCNMKQEDLKNPFLGVSIPNLYSTLPHLHPFIIHLSLHFGVKAWETLGIFIASFHIPW